MNVDPSHLEAAKIFKALGEPNRLSIVKLLDQHYELCCADIGERLEFKGSTLSHHLKQLAESGVIRMSRKEGTFHYYQLNQDVMSRHYKLWKEGE